jgi:hypothetical protein
MRFDPVTLRNPAEMLALRTPFVRVWGARGDRDRKKTAATGERDRRNAPSIVPGQASWPFFVGCAKSASDTGWRGRSRKGANDFALLHCSRVAPPLRSCLRAWRWRREWRLIERQPNTTRRRRFDLSASCSCARGGCALLSVMASWVYDAVRTGALVCICVGGAFASGGQCWKSDCWHAASTLIPINRMIMYHGAPRRSGEVSLKSMPQAESSNA